MKDVDAFTEASRLAALRELEILDTDSEETFDRLVRMAAEVVGVPVAGFTLVDEARVWLKSRIGTPMTETARSGAFCHYAMASDDVFVVEDASLDARFADSALVSDNGVRFYAGAPVTLADGAVVGTVCVFDTVVRTVPDAAALALLKGLAVAGGHLLDLRRELATRRKIEQALREHARLLELAEDMVGIGTWRLDVASGDLEQSPGINKIYGLSAELRKPDVDALLAMYDPVDRSRLVAKLEAARTVGLGYDLDARLRRAGDGALRDVRIKATVECDADGKPARLIGVLRDVTAEKRAFAALDRRRVQADSRADQMGRLALTDPLTGLPNRRAFLMDLEATLKAGQNAFLAILDLDHFKAVNDRFGHDIGDDVLVAFGLACSTLEGEGCRVGRIGGEEFALLFANGDGSQALAQLETLRTSASSRSPAAPDGSIIHIAFSAGLAETRPGDDPRALLRRADEALYQAKSAGRNRTALAA